MSNDCRVKLYSVEAAIEAVMKRDDVAVAYRCSTCPGAHVSSLTGSRGGNGAGPLNVLKLMSEGRFLVG